MVKTTLLFKLRGRLVLLGDHIKIAKEGRRMPCIETHHQDSQNSGKAEYIEGHIWGQISAVLTDGVVSRAIPLTAQLQESGTKTGGDTLITQTVKLAGEVTKNADRAAISVFDAYFSSATTFKAADEIVNEKGERMLEIITRAKSNAVAYRDPPAPVKGKPGRPRKYGEKVVLYDLFVDKSVNFTSVEMTLYGKVAEVQYLCRDLIWRPAERKIRFVLVKTGTKKAVLMSSDRTLTAQEIITLYSNRFKIERGFDEQKNDMGGFAYHFWTDALPKRKRSKEAQTAPTQKQMHKIQRAKQASEAWVCLSIIATGILSIIGFSYNRDIWNSYNGYLRTIRSTMPSVATTKSAISRSFLAFLPQINTFAFISKIQRRTDSANFAA